LLTWRPVKHTIVFSKKNNIGRHSEGNVHDENVNKKNSYHHLGNKKQLHDILVELRNEARPFTTLYSN
jgi:hypothetical protein